MNNLPEKVTNEEELEEAFSYPSKEVKRPMSRPEGDLLFFVAKYLH